MVSSASPQSSQSSLWSLPPGTNRRALLIVILGLLALFVPTYIQLANEVWGQEAYGHGPMILGVCLWLLWFDRHRIFEGEASPDHVSGFGLLFVALAIHWFGHVQSINMATTFAQPLAFGACLLIVHGWSSLKRAWFPLFFMIFMIPWPEVVVQVITMPLKHAVSAATEALLFAAGYPIGRSGVTLTIGPYQLLVADACSGMNSLLTLESLGLLYMRLMNYRSKARNVALALAIIPTSFVANVTRVIILVLVTYYFGDEAGQGFVHSFSGMVLFAISLVSIYLIDQAFNLVFKSDRVPGQGSKA
jgi:exosortase B